MPRRPHRHPQKHSLFIRWFIKLLRLLDSNFHILIAILASVLLYFILSKLHTIFDHALYYYHHPVSCTWALFESAIFHLGHPLKFLSLVWLFIFSSSNAFSSPPLTVTMNMTNTMNYTLQHHTLEFPYSYDGNRKSCHSDSLFNSNSNSNSVFGSGLDLPELLGEIFTNSLVPTTSSSIKTPGDLKNAIIELRKLSINQTTTLPLTTSLTPFIDSVIVFEKSLSALQASELAYRELWLHTISTLSNSWSATLSKITTSIITFENSLKSYQSIHFKFPYIDPITAYHHSATARDMLGEIQLAHCEQIVRTKDTVMVFRKSGFRVKRNLYRLRSSMVRMKKWIEILQEDMDKLKVDKERSEKEQLLKQQTVIHSIFSYFRGRNYTGIINEKNREDGISPLETIKKELKTLEGQMEEELLRMDKLMKAWEALKGERK
ncbi:hypothetical protein H4I96_12191 [Botrytis cinerea]